MTTCSIPAAAIASNTARVRGTRTCGNRRAASTSARCSGNGSNPSQLSASPSNSGTPSSAHPAPGPHASASTSPSPAYGVSRSSTGPSGVRVARHTLRRTGSNTYAGSPGPFRNPPITECGSTTRPARQTRTTELTPPSLTHPTDN